MAVRPNSVSAPSSAAARLADVLDLTGIGSWDWDLSQERVCWNQAHHRLCGLEPGTYSGDPAEFMAMVHPDDVGPLQEVVRAAIATGGAFARIHRIRRRDDGAERWVDARGQFFHDEAGRPVSGAGILRDITEQEQQRLDVETSEARFRGFFEQLPLSVLVFDREGRPVSGNPASRRLWSAAAEDAPANFTIWQDEQLDRAGVLPLIRQAFEGQPVDVPPIRYDLGRVVDGGAAAQWIESRLFPLLDAAGAVAQVVAIQEDVTPRIQAAAERERMLEGERAARVQLEDQAVELELQTAEMESSVVALQEANEAVTASEERLRALREASPVGIYEADADGRVTYTNRHFQQIYGTTGEALLDEEWRRSIHPDDLHLLTEGWQEAVAAEEGYEAEFRVLRPDGGVRWVRSRAAMLRSAGEPSGFVGTVQDVTEDRQVEADQQFLFDFGAALQSVHTPEQVLSLAVERVGQRLGAWRCGWSTIDLERRTFTLQHMFLAPDSSPEPVQLPITLSFDAWPADTPARLRAGQPVVIDDLAQPSAASVAAVQQLRGTTRALLLIPVVRDGEWVALFGVLDDRVREWTPREITLARLAAERVWPANETARALVRADLERRRLEAVLDALPVGVVVADAAGHVTAVTSATRRIWHEDLTAAPSIVDIHRRGRWRDSGEPLRTDDWPLVRALRGERTSSREIEIERADGSVATIIDTAAPILDAAGRITGAVAVKIDVSDRLELEARMRQSQKMEAVGQLAGGIAHDFNNLLMVIVGCLEFVRGDLPQQSPALHDLAEISRAAERARVLVRQLLVFSRQQALELRPVDLNALIHDAEQLLRRVIGEEIVLEIAVHPTPAVVRADPGQMEQVLLNLAVNARDAMLADEHGRSGRGGTLTIATDMVTLGENGAATHELPRGRYVRLQVRDTGHGMDDVTRERLFDPFFTTKALGRGTGLGLATVYGIVHQSDGAIDVESAPGAGASFTILFPESADPLTVQPRRPTPPPRGSGTVLLVEDESAVRATARRHLERHGYTVLEARHGVDALLVWRDQRARIDLLLTDLRMPEMGGRELVARLRADAPGLPVVYMSGYPDQGAALADGDHEAFLEKPFSGATLLAAVAAASCE